MTLNEIRSQMAKLRTTTSQLQKKEKKYLTDIKKIDSKSNSIKALISDDKETIAGCKKFISANENSKDPKIVARVAERKNQQAEAEKSLKSLEEDLRKNEQEKEKIEKNPEYANLSKEISEAKKGINEICDILEQDPTINAQLQLAVKFRFSKEISIQNKEKQIFEKVTKGLPDALVDDSKDGLKNYIEAIKSAKADKIKADRDIKADSNAAKKKLFDARQKLQNEIKSKFGIEVEPNDIDYILSQSEAGKIDDTFVLPSITVKTSKVDAIISKLEKSRDEMLKELEAKKSIPVAQNDQKIEENNYEIEKIREEYINYADSEIVRMQEEIAIRKQDIEEVEIEITEKETEIEIYNNEISDMDKKIDEEKANAGDLSDANDLIKAEEDLKENHIISEDAVTDLKDENSSISIVFNEFSNADLEVRKAFENCKSDNSQEAMEALKQAISEYKRVSETLKNISGYDQEAWQNYLKENLNERIDSGETLDSAYYNQENENFKKMKFDKNISQNEGVLEAYNEIGNKLEEIDVCQNAILNGSFDMPVEELFMNKDLGYHKLVNDMQRKNTSSKASFYDMIKSPKLIKPSLWNRFKGLVSKGFSKITKSKKFELPHNKKDLEKAYKNASTPEAIEAKKRKTKILELEKSKKDKENDRDALATEMEELVNKKVSLDGANVLYEQGIIEMEDLKAEGEKQIAELEAENKKIAEQNAKNPKAASKIEQTEDLEFVTREDNILSNSLDRMQLNKKIDDDLER